jgi:hypothetical protein
VGFHSSSFLPSHSEIMASLGHSALLNAECPKSSMVSWMGGEGKGLHGRGNLSAFPVALR